MDKPETEDRSMSLVCHEHSKSPAMARCVACGKLLCESCAHPEDGRNHCAACRPAPARKAKPAVAGLLSLVPGLGQMYSGHPIRSLMWLAIIVFLLQQGIRHEAWPLFASAWFLNICDAFALARRPHRLRGNAGIVPAKTRPSLSPDKAFLGLTVAGLGSAFLLQNSVAPGLSVTVMWPVALALFGLTVAFSRS